MRPLDEALRLLRVSVQNHTAMPGTITVTSALRGDGTTLVACGLARAFAEAGLRTLLVDANVANPGVSRELGTTSTVGSPFAPRNGEIPRLWTASFGVADPEMRPGNGLMAMFDGMRENYDITIVDAPPLPLSSTTLELIAASTGVLCAVRLGRKPSDADHELLRLIANYRARLIGVVPTNPQTKGQRSKARVKATAPAAELLTPPAREPVAVRTGVRG